MNKQELIDHLANMLEARIQHVSREIDSIRTSQSEDTKSSAGDKHEVGRAMMQQEMDKHDSQLARLRAMQRDLLIARGGSDTTCVRNGCLVTTDAGIYFIAIGLGPVEFNGRSVFVISIASPIGQALKDKRTGDTVSFNGKIITIHSIDRTAE